MSWARRRRRSRRLRGARAGGVRHAAAAREGPPRAAGRQPLQGDPGVGRPARRGDDRARHGRGGRRAAAGERPRVHRACSATLFVLFTLFVNATTLGLVMHAARARQADAASSSRCATACSRCRGSTSTRHLQQIIAPAQCPGRGHRRRSGLGRRGRDRGGAGQSWRSTLDERLKVGLVTLCTREKELYLELFEQQILSRRMVAVLAARADRLIDAVRDRGVGRLRGVAARHLALPIAASGSALWLHRRLGSSALLTERAGRPLRDPDGARRACWPSSRRSTCSSVADLLGADAEVELAARDRRTAQEPSTARCKALSLQYPGYADRSETRAARARRHPLRGGGIRPPPARGRSSAARSMTTCASSSPSGAAPSASGRRSISASS